MPGTAGQHAINRTGPRRRAPVSCLAYAAAALAMLAVPAANVFAVGQWQREILEFSNPGVTGNPFELVMDATFSHADSGTTITLPAYYAGNDTWKVGFMPTHVGRWTYTTMSADPDLNGITGSIESTESDLPGMLRASPENAKKWKFTDGDYVVPIGLQFSVMLEDGALSEFETAASFLADRVGGHLFNFRLNPNDIAFSNVAERRFDTALWDRLEQRMEILREKGLGVSVMFYTDDSGEPSFAGRSETEALLIRYAVARLAGYPVVLFNTGIDISEYRTGADINWWGERVAALDPYDHPRSSRHGGGSGSDALANRNFDSLGASTAVAQELVGLYSNADAMPVAIDDNWGEQFRRGNFSPADIRRAFWKITVAGGLASHVRDDTTSDFDGANDPDAWFHTHNMSAKLESEQWLALINPFIRTTFGEAFGGMEPRQELVSGDGAYALADPAAANLLIYLIGQNDSFDSGGGSVVLKLGSSPHEYEAAWFDPRTGAETAIGTLTGGTDHALDPPSSDDWVLYLKAEGAQAAPPNPPTDLTAD